MHLNPVATCLLLIVLLLLLGHDTRVFELKTHSWKGERLDKEREFDNSSWDVVVAAAATTIILVFCFGVLSFSCWYFYSLNFLLQRLRRWRWDCEVAKRFLLIWDPLILLCASIFVIMVRLKSPMGRTRDVYNLQVAYQVTNLVGISDVGSMGSGFWDHEIQFLQFSPKLFWA